MKAGDRAAGDGDEAERKNLPGEDRPGAVDEAREGRQLQFGADKQNADPQHEYHPQLHKRAEVIARRQQQPHGQRAGQKSIEDDAHRQGHRAQREPRRGGGGLGDPLARENARHHQHESDGRDLQYAARPPIAQVQTHQQSDGHGGGDGEGAPGAALESIHHHQPDHRQQDDHDEQHRYQGDESADAADLLARHLAQRLAVAAHGGEQDHEILHGPAQHRADDNPQGARQIAELSRQHRPDQRPRPGDGREVVSKHDPLIGGFEIVPVAQAFRGSGALVVQRHHARGNEFGVEAISGGVAGRSRQHQP